MQKAPESQRVRYVSDGIPELQGQWVEVPGDLPIDRAAQWIEEDFAARAEQERIDAENTAIAQEASAEPEIDRLDQLSESLAEIHSRLDTGDAAQYAQAIRDNASAMQSSFAIAQDLKGLDKRAQAQAQMNQSLLTEAENYANSAKAEREKTTALIKANQKIVNESFLSYAEQIKALRKELWEAQSELGELRAAAKENRALINKAARLLKAQESS